jgi:hypothetical protein
LVKQLIILVDWRPVAIGLLVERQYFGAIRARIKDSNLLFVIIVVQV